MPSVAVVAAALLAMGLVQLPNPRTESRFASIWLLGSGAEGARLVLSTIAGSLITVTGVVFSVTIVTLQLASSQFTPRMLRSFVADRVNQGVLGVFIGTFTYTLLVLRTIRSEPGGGEPFVPTIAVTTAVVLLLVSVGALILFINHAARSVQASVILHREARRTLERMAVLFPADVGHAAPTAAGVAADAGADEMAMPPGAPATVTAAMSGYLQSVNGDALWSLADARRASPLVVRMELHVGAFAFPGKPLASVWPAELADQAVERAVRDAFVLGHERTPEQDVEYGIVELSDIAVRALSPGINDPTTAMHCVDRLTEILAALATRRHPGHARASADGTVRLLVRDTPLERAMGLAFDQILHFGGANPAIAKRLLESLLDLVRAVPRPHGATIAAQADAVARAARRSVEEPAHIGQIEALRTRVVEAAGRS